MYHSLNIVNYYLKNMINNCIYFIIVFSIQMKEITIKRMDKYNSFKKYHSKKIIIY